MKPQWLVMASLAVLVARAGTWVTAQSPGTRPAGALYQQLCAGCHGPAMQRPGRMNLVDDRWIRGASDEDIATSIRTAHPATADLADRSRLSDSEVRALVIYIREVRANHLRTANLFTRSPSGARLESRRHAFQLETVVEGVEHPWAIAFAADGRMFITEKAGRLRIVEKGRLLPEAVSGTPAVWAKGQGGLLDVALGRDLDQREWIYLSYADAGPSDTAMTALVRGRVVDGRWVDQEVLFRAQPEAAYRLSMVHFGSRIVLDGQGLLFFSVGERGHALDAQDLTRSNGKIHRLREDGVTPADNPLLGRPDVLDTIWSCGHRNPQGLARHPVTGELWEAEHGPRGGDELNRIVRGGNYGWPLVSFGMNHSGTAISAETEREGLESPVYHWTPSITVSSIEFYTGDKFPGWRHDLLIGSLVPQDVRRLVIERGVVVEEEVLFAGFGRVRDLITGPDGYVYIALNSPDRIVRLLPATSDKPAAMP